MYKPIIFALFVVAISAAPKKRGLFKFIIINHDVSFSSKITNN